MKMTCARTLVSLTAPALLAAAIAASTPNATAAGPKRPGVRLPEELARVLTDYEKAWAARDPVRLAALFVEDGWVLPNGSPPVQGRSAIEKYYKGHGGALSLRALAFATNGDLGYILGAYAARPDGEDDGKFTLTLRKVGARWAIVSDMDNGNRPRR
jgi:ketosteroid isomerase-like protein